MKHKKRKKTGLDLKKIPFHSVYFLEKLVTQSTFQ